MKLPLRLLSHFIGLLSMAFTGVSLASTSLPSKVKNPNPRVIEKKQVSEIRIEHYPAREGSREDSEQTPSLSGAPKPAPRQAFDPVPPTQVASLVRRLEITTALLRKYGRAYDYRVHATRELEGVLAELDRRTIPLPPPAPEASEREEAPAAEDNDENAGELLILPPPPTGN